jgi:hypothetical protein
MASDRTYDVGYGKPPRHTRWKKGQSGNPKGRPPRDRSVSALVGALLSKRVVVRDGKTTRRMSRLDELLHRTLERALAGDPRLVRMLLDEARKEEARAEARAEQDAPAPFGPKDREVIDALLKRLSSPHAPG